MIALVVLAASCGIVAWEASPKCHAVDARVACSPAGECRELPAPAVTRVDPRDAVTNGASPYSGHGH